MSFRLKMLDLGLRVTEKRRLARSTDPIALRNGFERRAASVFRPVPGTRIVDARLPGGAGPMPVKWISTETSARSRVVLYFHGGAYFLGSAATHQALGSAIAALADVRVVLPDYRLTPEHPFPSAPEDALAAYTGLLEAGYEAGNIVLAGDSAGGGLALALLHMIGEEGLPHPAATVAFSPWCDMTLSGDSLVSNVRRDAILPAARLPEVVSRYLDGAEPTDPRASPLFGTFRGAGPVLIQASKAELLADDARRMGAKLTADGVDVELDLWPGCFHCWQMFHGKLPEADVALDRAAAFIRAHLG
ncbi:acetyl esterase/lipase [Rubricella aquisinus]|uniref:Acetyl esterase/lipase n=1 Tax=Rubricella aquisinus TaxID=2028108 RepID=A0A840WJE3_9RHOB|nr:alpha/beta hydrolase [Rubricella aquisinus]MBB5514313.1 acetyl esterase/lipase [Rubricella aquisinus]